MNTEQTRENIFTYIIFIIVFRRFSNPWSPDTVDVNLTHCTDLVFREYIKKIRTLEITSNVFPASFFMIPFIIFLVWASCPPSGENDVGYNFIHYEKFFGFFKEISKEKMIS